MNRFFGMMPSSEVEKEEHFRVGVSQLTVTIQAGKKGWTILYADGSSEYKDEINSTENNFNKALQVLRSHFVDVKRFKQSDKKEEYMEFEIPPYEDINEDGNLKYELIKPKDLLKEAINISSDVVALTQDYYGNITFFKENIPIIFENTWVNYSNYYNFISNKVIIKWDSDDWTKCIITINDL